LTIKIIEKINEDELNCPVCGEKIYDEQSINENYCSHTLFIATSDGGFEFCDERVKANLNIPFDVEINEYISNNIETGVSELTDKISIPNSIKIIIYEPSPGMLEVYYGYVE